MDDKKLEYREYILSEDWNKKRKLAFKLFGKKCQRCKNTKTLHVHHKTYINFKNENVETDLAILCKKCHDKYHDTFGKATIGTTDMFIKHLLMEDKPQSKFRGKKSKVTSFAKQYTTKKTKNKQKRQNLHSDYYREVKFQRHQELRDEWTFAVDN